MACVDAAAVSHPACWGRKQYMLVGSQHSYFTGKLRAYLHHRGVPFVEVVSSMEVYTGVILPRTGVRFIPVLVTPGGDVLQDTTHIIAVLEQLQVPWAGPRAVPGAVSRPRQHLACMLLELFADEWLTLPAMHYRWSFPEQRPFVDAEFGMAVAPGMPAADRLGMAHATTKHFGGLLPLLGVHPSTVPAVEAGYRHMLATLNAHFADHPYLLGDRPSLADVALYGPFGPHLFRDPIPGRIMQLTAPHMAHWVERMAHQPGALAREDFFTVGNAGRLEPARGPHPRRWHGEWLPDDAVPEAVVALLRMMFQDFIPVLLDGQTLVKRFLDDNPAAFRLPRAVGKHAFDMRTRGGGCGCTSASGCECVVGGTRMAMTYPLWMLQRATDAHAAAKGSARAAMDKLLDDVSPSARRDFALAHEQAQRCRLHRVKNHVVRGGVHPGKTILAKL